MADKQNGTDGGTFTSPVHPDDHTPATGGGFHQGTGAPGSDVAFPGNGELNPTNETGSLDNQAAFGSATGV